jgi:hypothetical protein
MPAPGLEGLQQGELGHEGRADHWLSCCVALAVTTVTASGGQHDMGPVCHCIVIFAAPLAQFLPLEAESWL